MFKSNNNYVTNQQPAKQKPAVIGRAVIDFGFEHREVEVNYYRIQSGIFTIFTHDRETGKPQKILVSSRNVVLMLDRAEYIPRYEDF